MLRAVQQRSTRTLLDVLRYTYLVLSVRVTLAAAVAVSLLVNRKGSQFSTVLCIPIVSSIMRFHRHALAGACNLQMFRVSNYRNYSPRTSGTNEQTATSFVFTSIISCHFGAVAVLEPTVLGARMFR